MSRSSRCLYLVICAAPPAVRIAGFIAELQADGWRVVVIATPSAATWVDLDALSAQTGCLTRSHARRLYDNDSLPPADVVVVAAPLTFNTLNQWASGINDTLALGVLNEIVGTDVPIIAAPCVKTVLRTHPAYEASLARLAIMGVTVLDPDAITFKAADGLANFDWSQIHAAIDEIDA